ncbi:MAG: hypothetical protein OEV44_02835 [Spirochaetota bacterium]|nr:hypothetical protein [Spirochaetota bacterium]
MKMIEKLNDNQTVYELDFYVYKLASGTLLKTMFENDPPKLKPEYEFVDATDRTKFITISDAKTHIERLVFPTYRVRKIETGDIFFAPILNHVAGYHTFMIHGGDSRACYSPRAYELWLRKNNPQEEIE